MLEKVLEKNWKINDFFQGILDLDQLLFVIYLIIDDLVMNVLYQARLV